MNYSVSNQDLELVKTHKWYVNIRGYLVATDDSRLTMHRFIMGQPDSSIDHINGIKTDNRRSNLRICNQSQNCANSKISKNNTSGFKGVSWNKALLKWHAYIMVNRKRKHLGYFTNKTKAALIYNEAALVYFGEFAKLNEVKI